jgi:hypothetical protein
MLGTHNSRLTTGHKLFSFGLASVAPVVALLTLDKKIMNNTPADSITPPIRSNVSPRNDETSSNRFYRDIDGYFDR